MDLAVDVVLVLVGMAALWLGAHWVVESAALLAARFGISELVIGLTVVSIGTSAPEFATSITSALTGRGDISVGNIVGSNIFNLGFILGGVAMVSPIRTHRLMVWRDGMVLVGATLLLLLFLWDNQLTLPEGLVMLAGLVIYLTALWFRREAVDEEMPEGEFRWHTPLLLIAGLALIVVGGKLLVEAASDLANAFGVSEWVIGVTIVAAGTSLPELVTSLLAVVRGHHGISAGNLIGSDLFNQLGVLGLASAITTLHVAPESYNSVIALCGMVVLVVVMMRFGWQLNRWNGALLIGLGAVRWVMDFT